MCGCKSIPKPVHKRNSSSNTSPPLAMPPKPSAKTDLSIGRGLKELQLHNPSLSRPGSDYVLTHIRAETQERDRSESSKIACCLWVFCPRMVIQYRVMGRPGRLFLCPNRSFVWSGNIFVLSKNFFDNTNDS